MSTRIEIKFTLKGYFIAIAIDDSCALTLIAVECSHWDHIVVETDESIDVAIESTPNALNIDVEIKTLVQMNGSNKCTLVFAHFFGVKNGAETLDSYLFILYTTKHIWVLVRQYNCRAGVKFFYRLSGFIYLPSAPMIHQASMAFILCHCVTLDNRLSVHFFHYMEIRYTLLKGPAIIS